MDVSTIRHANLLRLIREAGGKKELASRARLKGNILSQVDSRGEKKKGIGHGVARTLESAMNKPFGWMDNDHSQTNTDDPRLRVTRVKLVSWADAGGRRKDMMAVSEADTETEVTTSVEVGSGAFALRVRGDSMVDGGPASYPPGSIIIVDPTLQAHPGDPVVVKLANTEEAVFKQLETDGAAQYLKPLNPRYPIMPFPHDAIILGVVVQVQIDVRRRTTG